MKNSEYNEIDFEMNYPKGMENYYWTFCRKKILFSELSKHQLTDKKILEIGLGKDLFVSYLRKKI